jgi:hypothetical protein
MVMVAADRVAGTTMKCLAESCFVFTQSHIFSNILRGTLGATPSQSFITKLTCLNHSIEVTAYAPPHWGMEAHVSSAGHKFTVECVGDARKKYNHNCFATNRDSIWLFHQAATFVSVPRRMKINDSRATRTGLTCHLFLCNCWRLRTNLVLA